MDIFSRQESAFYTSGRNLDHGVIDPRDSRKVLGFALETVLEARRAYHRTADAVIDAGGELAMVVPPPSLEESELRRKLSSLPSAADIAALPAMTERALAMDIGQTLFWGQLGRKLYAWELYEESLAVFQRRSALLERSRTSSSSRT